MWILWSPDRGSPSNRLPQSTLNRPRSLNSNRRTVSRAPAPFNPVCPRTDILSFSGSPAHLQVLVFFFVVFLAAVFFGLTFEDDSFGAAKAVSEVVGVVTEAVPHAHEP